MISTLRGILKAKQAPAVVIEVAGGIGYEVFMPLNSFYHLPAIDKEVFIYTHFIIRENEQLLYGFINEKQRSLFRTLIKVNGIGPKIALTILSGVEIDLLIKNILNGDVSNLVRVPGVGAKTAQRLVIELRDKVDEFKPDNLLAGIAGGIDNCDAASATAAAAIRDAVCALIALGYKPQEAQRAISKHRDKNLPSEELVRLALKEM
jgi:holliday junction DNA helicase RuvA